VNEIGPSTAIGVLPSSVARSALRPVGSGQVTVYSGFWGELLRTNRERTIPHGFDQLRRTGTLHNLRLVTGSRRRVQGIRRLRRGGPPVPGF
jgi:hypothetical protein